VRVQVESDRSIHLEVFITARSKAQLADVASAVQGNVVEATERMLGLEVGEVNVFMESVLAGLQAAVFVVDHDQRVLVWNRQAEDLWGVRREEAVGRHLLGLDIGLPLERLKPLLLGVLDGEQDGMAREATLPALNRRGRSLEVRVTATPLRRNGGAVTGAIILVEQERSSPGS
jgi:two-component system CheB/CheR fusion protein